MDLSRFFFSLARRRTNAKYFLLCLEKDFTYDDINFDNYHYFLSDILISYLHRIFDNLLVDDLLVHL